MNDKQYEYGLLEAIGIEIEYMIVGLDSLDVLAVTDEVLKAAVGSYESEVELGPIAWSNELALHVIELKTNGPVKNLKGVAQDFQANVEQINELLSVLGGRLMPGAMHPWMDPMREMRLWPHDNNPIYEAFNRIFDCRGHGWANLQSTHINLAFGNSQEFGALHAACRLILPLLPALAASSPMRDGKLTGLLDTRLDVYRHNADKIPSVAGRVIPEAVFTPSDYNKEILQPIYADLSPHDPKGTIRHEWANSRGCIARFDRGAIEIRVLDTQECPRADLAIADLVVRVVSALCDETLSSQSTQRAFAVEPLAAIFESALVHGDRVVIDDSAYCAALGLSDRVHATGLEMWQRLDEITANHRSDPAYGESLATIFEHGCLSRRLSSALGSEPSIRRQREVYGRLCTCLNRGEMFVES